MAMSVTVLGVKTSFVFLTTRVVIGSLPVMMRRCFMIAGCFVVSGACVSISPTRLPALAADFRVKFVTVGCRRGFTACAPGSGMLFRSSASVLHLYSHVKWFVHKHSSQPQRTQNSLRLAACKEQPASGRSRLGSAFFG
jgi:hypothetical protein